MSTLHVSPISRSRIGIQRTFNPGRYDVTTANIAGCHGDGTVGGVVTTRDVEAFYLIARTSRRFTICLRPVDTRRDIYQRRVENQLNASFVFYC